MKQYSGSQDIEMTSSNSTHGNGVVRSSSGRRRSRSSHRNEKAAAAAATPQHHSRMPHLPQYNHNGHKVTKGVHPDGESGRRGVDPLHFLRIAFRSSSRVSMMVNLLWPFVPVAFALNYARPNLHNWVFAMNYIAMVPTANLIGFAGQELARKIPKVFGVILETFLGSIVEIVLFMVLLVLDYGTGANIPVIQAAILGSILAYLLLCLGTCFFVGGMNRDAQKFDATISETGSGLLLTAGFGLAIPHAFAVGVREALPNMGEQEMQDLVNQVSRATAIVLLISFLLFVWFQLRSHHGLFDAILEQDEEKDTDRHKDLKKAKFTFTEAIIAIVIAITLVSFHAVFLVQQIEPIIEEGHVTDAFMGLILVPLVEKLAEHLTAIDEAHDNQMNFALAHVLGATLQTALLNAPLVVIVGWGLHRDMDFDFTTFNVILLILAILVVGNFLRDGESNYLEGALLVLVYVIIAVSTYYFPNPEHGETGSGAESGGAEAGHSGGEAGAEAAARLVRMMLKT